jgi:molecular chaperone HscB
MNYFELFDYPVSPRIDKASLSKKYFTLQKSSHPDFFTQSSEDEKEDILKKSASINKAFEVFKDADKTMEYFLQIKGVIQTDEKYQLPNDFLMEMMELNEMLTEKDQETAIEEINNLENDLLEKIRPILEQGSAAFDDVSLEKLKAFYYKKKYLKRILARLNE